MATILIFSENWQIAHKLCDSYAKEKYDARLCSDPDQISAAADENGAPLMVIDAAMKWVVCRPIFERCRQTGSPILFVTSDRRMKSIVWPRHVSAWLARHTLPLSLPVIGRALGGRDHSTVMHALERVDGRRATDPVFRAQTDALRVACEQLPGALREISHAG